MRSARTCADRGAAPEIPIRRNHKVQHSVSKPLYTLLSRIECSSLGISIRTTEHHRAHIMEKMGVKTLSHLIKSALRLAD